MVVMLTTHNTGVLFVFGQLHMKPKRPPRVHTRNMFTFTFSPQEEAALSLLFKRCLCGETAEQSSKIKHVLSLKLSDRENHTSAHRVTN